MKKSHLSPSIDDVALKELEQFVCEHQKLFSTLTPQAAIDFLLVKIREFKLQTDDRFECELIEKKDGFSLRLHIKKN
ncbi:MAG: hypothetical protein ACOYLO_11935 [Ferruginibacter sp.]